MISLGPRLLFAFPPSTSSRAENQQQPRSQGNHLSAPCGIIYYYTHNVFINARRDSASLFSIYLEESFLGSAVGIFVIIS